MLHALSAVWIERELAQKLLHISVGCSLRLTFLGCRSRNVPIVFPGKELTCGSCVLIRKGIHVSYFAIFFEAYRKQEGLSPVCTMAGKTGMEPTAGFCRCFCASCTSTGPHCSENILSCITCVCWMQRLAPIPPFLSCFSWHPVDGATR